jgi:DNA-directed RNA polymerase specialized sigma24 family protein
MSTHPATSSHDLVQLARAGDEEAFRRLFEKYHRRLAVFAHYRLGEP